MARIEAGVVSLNRQRTRTPEYLRDIFESASRSARHEDLDFQVELSDAVTQIHVDKELLRVAINNLISNAIKYNRNGGRIVLSLRESDETISIEVRDTGVGIAPEEQEQIFDKFFRLPGAEAGPRSGHGLGLALAKQIVELHGGEIRVESTVGEGSQFTIVLPTAPSLEADA
jgi:signal transduction histidine kinase